MIAFIILLVVLGSIRPEFLSFTNVIQVLAQVSILGIIAVAITYVVIGGNFDISVGSFISFGNIFPMMLIYTMGPGSEPIAILATLGLGILVGCINGFLIGFLKLNSFMITLAMLSILSALSEIFFQGTAYGTLLNTSAKTIFSWMGRGMIGGVIPSSIVIFAVFAIILGIVLSKTVFGRYVYAVGGNRDASMYSGIREKWVTFYTFVLTGFAAALGAIIWGSRYLSIMTQQGKGYELTILTAVILGGTSLLGGSGNVFKTVIGVLIIGFVNSGVIVLGLPYYYQWLVTWFIIIVAVVLDITAKRRKEA
ncbi:MAG: ABC transporter permease [Clostridiaceae bacterium]|nr:ABC transporter permease [Clostridiaceae bacterium]